jgi:membrane-anchored protein YejM (alkaline phosphatase superfamily)
LNSQQITRGLLIRWSAWFGILNAALFSLIGVRYLLIYGWPGDAVATLYIGLAYAAQFALLGFVPLALFGSLIALLWPRKLPVLLLGVLLGSVGLSLMVLDTNVFEQYRFHLSALSVVLFDASTWVLTGVVFLAMLGFQAMLAGSVWNFVGARQARRGGWLALALVLVWCGGQGIHIWADATAYTPVTSFTRFMPLYFPIKAKRRLAKLGWVDPAKVEQQRMLRRASAPDSGQLKYPLQALQCEAAELPNIAVVFIDGLRPDRVSEETTPAIADFAAQSLQFTDHYSGGNSSRMGFFSFFYGLPSTYWQSFYDLQRPPVLMEQVQKAGYELMAFSSVGFGSPAQIDRTVFAATPPDTRRLPVAGYADPNSAITAQWGEWLQGRDSGSQPWFGFVYYDPGSFAASHEAALADELSKLQRREAAYMAGMVDMDNEIAQLLRTLDEAPGGRDTLVIIASDHGYEFDELGLGYIGHASNYGPWQLRSTLLMRWPGREPHVFSHRSAHQDVPATLLQEVLGCSNPGSDFSSGENLFAEQSWSWIIAGSYTSHAIIEPGQLVVSYPGGAIELLNTDYRPDKTLKLNAGLMQEAMTEMRRFFR